MSCCVLYINVVCVMCGVELLCVVLRRRMLHCCAFVVYASRCGVLCGDTSRCIRYGMLCGIVMLYNMV